MPEFTCRDCGSAFTLPEATLARYPGWTPRQCMSCRRGGGGAATASGERSDGGKRNRSRRPNSLVEENLTTAEVLERYTDGPDTGVFTDGSANPNPGPGGWGAVYVVGGEVVEQAHGRADHTTNNRMELTALIAAYDLVPSGTAVDVYTDSRLCVDTITKWAAGWKARGWQRKTGPVENLDLVRELYERSLARPELTLRWIRAHDGSRWNEYADSLSTAYLRDEV